MKKTCIIEKIVLFTNEFGYELFIADTSKTKNGLSITDNISEALIFSKGFDNTRIRYLKAITGYNLQERAIL